MRSLGVIVLSALLVAGCYEPVPDVEPTGGADGSGSSMGPGSGTSMGSAGTSTTATSSTATSSSTTGTSLPTTTLPTTGGLVCDVVPGDTLVDLYDAVCTEGGLGTCTGPDMATQCTPLPGCGTFPNGTIQVHDEAVVAGGTMVSRAVEMAPQQTNDAYVFHRIDLSFGPSCAPRFVTDAYCGPDVPCNVNVYYEVHDSMGNVLASSEANVTPGGGTPLDADLSFAANEGTVTLFYGVRVGLSEPGDRAFLVEPRIIHDPL